MTLPTWPVQDAKARFSELLDTCIAQGPQMVTKRGAEAAVLVPARYQCSFRVAQTQAPWRCVGVVGIG